MAARYTLPQSLSQRRATLREATGTEDRPSSLPEPLSTTSSRSPGGRNMVSNLSSTLPKPLPTPNKPINPLPSSLLPSAPASPPTPAPSPTPHHRTSNWQPAEDEEEDTLLLRARLHFGTLSNAQKQRFLVDILNLCDNQHLSFVSSVVSPRLRKDPFQAFPNELCLRVMSHFGRSCFPEGEC